MAAMYSVMQTQINMGWFVKSLSELEKNLERLKVEHLITANECEALLELGWKKSIKDRHQGLSTEQIAPKISSRDS